MLAPFSNPSRQARVTLEFDALDTAAAEFASALEQFRHNSRMGPLVQQMLKSASITHNHAQGTQRAKIEKLKSQINLKGTTTHE